MNAKKSAAPLLEPSLMKSLPVAAEAHADLLDFQLLTAKIEKELHKSKRGGAIALARSFVVLRALKRNLEETEKKFTALFEQFKNIEVPQMFEQEGVTSLPLAEGFRVGVSSAWRASIKEGMKPEAYKWLQENKLGDIIVETINASTLSATAKTLAEEENRQLPDEFFNVLMQPNTSVTQIKGKGNGK